MTNDILLYCTLMFIATLAGRMIASPVLIGVLAKSIPVIGTGISQGTVFMHLLSADMVHEEVHRASLFIQTGFSFIFLLSGFCCIAR